MKMTFKLFGGLTRNIFFFSYFKSFLFMVKMGAFDAPCNYYFDGSEKC